MLLPITNSGYGVGEAGKFCTEETPIRPVSLYGRDKVEVEQTLLDRHPAAISFRLATVFGMSPRMRLDLLVNDFTYRAYTDRFIVLFESHFKRNFIHVRDVARAFLHGIDHFDAMKGRSTTSACPTRTSRSCELCERIQPHLPSFVDSRVGHRHRIPTSATTSCRTRRSSAPAIGRRSRSTTASASSIKGFAMIRNRKYANV